MDPSSSSEHIEEVFIMPSGAIVEHIEHASPADSIQTILEFSNDDPNDIRLLQLPSPAVDINDSDFGINVIMTPPSQLSSASSPLTPGLPFRSKKIVDPAISQQSEEASSVSLGEHTVIMTPSQSSASPTLTPYLYFQSKTAMDPTLISRQNGEASSSRTEEHQNAPISRSSSEESSTLSNGAIRSLTPPTPVHDPLANMGPEHVAGTEFAMIQANIQVVDELMEHTSRAKRSEDDDEHFERVEHPDGLQSPLVIPQSQVIQLNTTNKHNVTPSPSSSTPSSSSKCSMISNDSAKSPTILTPVKELPKKSATEQAAEQEIAALQKIAEIWRKKASDLQHAFEKRQKGHLGDIKILHERTMATETENDSLRREVYSLDDMMDYWFSAASRKPCDGDCERLHKKLETAHTEAVANKKYISEAQEANRNCILDNNHMANTNWDNQSKIFEQYCRIKDLESDNRHFKIANDSLETRIGAMCDEIMQITIRNEDLQDQNDDYRKENYQLQMEKIERLQRLKEEVRDVQDHECSMDTASICDAKDNGKIVAWENLKCQAILILMMILSFYFAWSGSMLHHSEKIGVCMFFVGWVVLMVISEVCREQLDKEYHSGVRLRGHDLGIRLNDPTLEYNSGVHLIRTTQD